MATETTATDRRGPSLQARDGAFYLNGEKLVILSGSMHYFRVMPEYWRDRLLKMKACGLNCLDTYIAWNLHEEVKGHFDFEGMLDVRKYLQMAHEIGLYVILRPGPYICSEWDFGGLPSWLLSDPDMKVRCSYKPYLDAVENFFSQLLPKMKDLQYNKGGPIIAVQLENEYGSYGNDPVYKQFLKDMMVKHDITELYITSDSGMGMKHGDIPGALMTLNFQEKTHGLLMYKMLRHVKGYTDVPFLAMEFWSGWFDHWGKKHNVWPIEEFESALRWILGEAKGSVNFYMFHGGTNFGFMNGANEDLDATNDSQSVPYQPDVTSYDYDCQIAENGDLTPKFHKTRELIQTLAKDYVPAKLPDIPANIERTFYGTELDSTSGYVTLSGDCYISLENIISQIQVSTPPGIVSYIESPTVLCMEELPINNGGGQGYGFILYRTSCHVTAESKLRFTGRIGDRAQILMDGEVVAVINSSLTDAEVNLGLGLQKDQKEAVQVKLDILVENMGRVNYASFQCPLLNGQRKGLKGPVLVDGKELQNWKIYPLEMKKDFVTRVSNSDVWEKERMINRGPIGCRVTFQIEDVPKDCYVNMKTWGKGSVFVNGFNLGRYWHIGPQQTLYLPAPLLKTGCNEILIFELEGGRLETPPDRVIFCREPDLGETARHTTEIPAAMRLFASTLHNISRLGDWVWVVLAPIVRKFY